MSQESYETRLQFYPEILSCPLREQGWISESFAPLSLSQIKGHPSVRLFCDSHEEAVGLEVGEIESKSILLDITGFSEMEYEGDVALKVVASQYIEEEWKYVDEVRLAPIKVGKVNVQQRRFKLNVTLGLRTRLELVRTSHNNPDDTLVGDWALRFILY